MYKNHNKDNVEKLKINTSICNDNNKKTKRWILSVTPKMWHVIKKKNSYATATKTETARIKKYDLVIFYIHNTGKFNSIYKIQSKWHDPSKKWNTRVTDEIDLTLIQTGTASVRNLAPWLQFAKKSKWIGLYLNRGIGNYGNAITIRDYKTIAKHMEQSPNLFA